MMKVKILVLLAVIAVVTSVPSKQSKIGKEKSVDFKNFIQQQSLRNSLKDPISKLGYYESLMAEPANEKTISLNGVNLRLPNNTAPLHYELFIRTDIHAGYFGFSGTVRINIRAIEASNFITLHSSQSAILFITVFNADGSVFQEDATYFIDSGPQFLTVNLERNLLADREYVIEISYSGVMTQTPTGFYRTSYFNLNTSEIFWVAATHFQPFFARLAFPCYDEVRYRTTFDVKIQHHNTYNSISNMPISSVVENENNLVTTTFERTLVIPTYLLAFSVSNFGSISNDDEDLPITVYARPELIDSGIGPVVFLSERFLREMEEYFQIPYILPKSDLLANFRIRQVSNWGLITIDEFLVLEFDDDEETRRDQRHTVLARMYSHNYFGSLASISEWSYLWLNEGFVMLYENFFNDKLFPDKLIWENFFVNSYDIVVDSDSFWMIPALNEYAETFFEILDKFDFILNLKATILLRMFQSAFTEEVFLHGVKNYLNEMQLKSANPEDLYEAMQKAWDEMNPDRPLNIAEMMRPWFDQPGIPLVTVSRTSSGLRLTQEEFGPNHTEMFNIPISYATASTQNFDDTSAEFWLTANEMEISRDELLKELGENDWVIFNVRDTGYYVTNYSDELWRLIVEALVNDHEAIHFLNRGTLFADFNRLIQQNIDVSPTFFLEMMDSLKLEMHPHVWIRANIPLNTFERLMRGTDNHPLLLSFWKDTMTPIYGRTFEHNLFWATNVINHYSCLSGVEACLNNALSILHEVIEQGSTNYPFYYRCNGFLAADEETWMYFFDRALQATGISRISEFWDLECTQNKKLQEFFLDQALNTTNNLVSSERFSIFSSLLTNNHMGWETVIEFLENRVDDIINMRWGGLTSLFVGLAVGSNTESQAERVLALLDLGYPVFIERSLLEEIMEPNLRFFQTYSEEIFEWLVTRKSKLYN